MSYHRNLSFRDETIRITEVRRPTPGAMSRVGLRWAVALGAVGCLAYTIAANSTLFGQPPARSAQAPVIVQLPPWVAEIGAGPGRKGTDNRSAARNHTGEPIALQPWAALRKGWGERAQKRGAATHEPSSGASLRSRFLDQSPGPEIWSNLFLSASVRQSERLAGTARQATASAPTGHAASDRPAAGFSAPPRKDAAPTGLTSGGFAEVTAGRSPARPAPDDLEFAHQAVKAAESDFRFLGRAFAVATAFEQRYAGASEAGVIFNRLLQAQNRAAGTIQERSVIQKDTPLASVRLSEEWRSSMQACLADISSIRTVSMVTRPVSDLREGMAFIVSATVNLSGLAEAERESALLRERERVLPLLGPCLAPIFDHGTVALMLSDSADNDIMRRRIEKTPGSALFRRADDQT